MPRILLVDDDAHVSRVMQIWLSRNGYELVVAGNGAEGLKIVTGGGIDLVVSDYNMPVMDGLEMIEAIRDNEFAELPIILLTARCERDSLSKRLEPLGVTVFPKPFVASRLVTEIQRRLSAPAEGGAVNGAPLAVGPAPASPPSIQKELR